MTGFFGIAWWVWGLGCLGVAAIYTILWPRPAGARSQGRQLVLRWFHALVWLLLALSCFLRAGWLPAAQMADPVALLALLVYGVFLLTLARERASR